MSNVIISKDQYGRRLIEATVSFKMKFDIDRYGKVLPEDSTTMALQEAKDFAKYELVDMTPSDLWEQVVNFSSLSFKTDDKE